MLKTQNLNASYKLFTVSTVVDGGGGGDRGKVGKSFLYSFA